MRASNKERGFSLLEIAVALAVITLLLGSILVPLQTQVESRKYGETQKLLDQAREALLGYAAAYGYFPCPANASSNGQEAGANHSTGACTTYHGFLPAVTLGFTPTDNSGYALDAWGTSANRIRYSVSNTTVFGITNPFTRINGMRSAGMSNIMSANLFYVCDSGTGVTSGTDCGTAVTLTSNAPVVVWSLGPNAATGGSNPHESENVDSNRTFVMRIKSGVSGSEFDDILTWISPVITFNRLIVAGQLP
jgi:prepilin-type N-terminal cleavage/methylation domain-containing protein